jgi:cytosine/adenosine deaminase-related metal-dependent hydrolase
MYDCGIQAVGDICNKLDTFKTKEKSPIHYYSFVEFFDLMQSKLTQHSIENYTAVYLGQSTSGLNKKSFVPHAPYSVTPEMFEYLNQSNHGESSISIHNQETPDEIILFKEGKGKFFEFFESLGLSLDDFKATGKSPIHYILDHLKPQHRNLFVHNTLTLEEDIAAVHNWSENAYWVSCPNANLYIENYLPNYSYFLNQNAKMCLGTDSIMSNWQLDIWEEVKTIKKYQSYVSLENLFKWATLNGAEALSYDDHIGSIEVGKTPGLVHIDLRWDGENTDISKSRSKRII